tara:strand:+ start:1250 stop:1621 length:372 start_codon:yes stop_codon:yes gene_type:complete
MNMKYLLMTLLIILISCADTSLAEERIWEKNGLSLKTKFIDNSAHYIFNAKLKNCDLDEITGFVIEFVDDEDYRLDREIVFKRYMNQNECELEQKGILSPMDKQNYKRIADVSFEIVKKKLTE